MRPITSLILFVLGCSGYIINAIKLITMGGDSCTTLMLFRILGVAYPPLGVVLGLAPL